MKLAIFVVIATVWIKLITFSTAIDLAGRPDVDLPGGHKLSDPLPPLVLPKLPYEYNALEPIIDEETMKIHHLKHQEAYRAKAQSTLHQLCQEGGAKDIWACYEDPYIVLRDMKTELPKKFHKDLRNALGGFWNHKFFFDSLHAPIKDNKPSVDSYLYRNILSQWGSFETFQEKFEAEALSVFGSGWAWLTMKCNKIADGSCQLFIEKSSNQDLPVHTPVIGLDVWEHAYYIKYQNRRIEYVRGFWQLIDWKKAEQIPLKECPESVHSHMRVMSASLHQRGQLNDKPDPTELKAALKDVIEGNVDPALVAQMKERFKQGIAQDEEKPHQYP
jgi:Fe-Mn family superoxide dismutase